MSSPGCIHIIAIMGLNLVAVRSWVDFSAFLESDLPTDFFFFLEAEVRRADELELLRGGGDSMYFLLFSLFLSSRWVMGGVDGFSL
jgi:hypothetical protein